MDFDDFRVHFPTDISQDIQDFAPNEVFLKSRYIFTRREGKKQFGYCTHCHTSFPTLGLSHNGIGTCPNCQSECKVKASGLGHKSLINEAYFVYYEKSFIDPEAVIARGFYAVYDFSGEYRQVKVKLREIARYLFKMGGSVMFKRSCYYSMAGTMQIGQWERTGSVHTLFYKDHIGNIPTRYSRESIAAAVAGTPFRFSTWESYKYADMTTFFDLYSRYPCVEYLTKVGMKNLVDEKLNRERTYGAINWNGKNLLKVLRLSKQDLSEIKQQRIYVDFFFLRVMQDSKKRGWGLTFDEIKGISRDFEGADYYERLLQFMQYGPIRKIIGYLNKQAGKIKSRPCYILSDWRDYLADCQKLEMNLTDESVIFPRDLHQAHQNTIKQVKYKADKEISKKIADRVRSLKKTLYFRSGELFIRPGANAQELIDEGKALNHCVGGYAARYAAGQTVILFIRQAAKPGKPYFTMEIRGDQIIQCRGLKNCEPDEAVKAFMAAFENAKLKKLKSNPQVKIAV